jgi:hypothetical protein
MKLSINGKVPREAHLGKEEFHLPECFRAMRRKYLLALTSDAGSISPLISGLFLILLILSGGLVNLSDAYLAKRELIQIVEPQVQSAVQSIDLYRYYSGDQFVAFKSLFDVNQNRVPINCREAVNRLRFTISQINLRESQINLAAVVCTDDELSIDVTSTIHPIIDFPFFKGALGFDNSPSGEIIIRAKVGATSIYR